MISLAPTVPMYLYLRGIDPLELPAWYPGRKAPSGQARKSSIRESDLRLPAMEACGHQSITITLDSRDVGEGGDENSTAQELFQVYRVETTLVCGCYVRRPPLLLPRPPGDNAVQDEEVIDVPAWIQACVVPIHVRWGRCDKWGMCSSRN